MSDPTLYLYTSLTAGSSHIVTATARLETILKANKLPFRAIDVATDDAARKLWGRRSKGKKLPGLVKYGTVVGVGYPLPFPVPVCSLPREMYHGRLRTQGGRGQADPLVLHGDHGLGFPVLDRRGHISS